MKLEFALGEMAFSLSTPQNIHITMTPSAPQGMMSVCPAAHFFGKFFQKNARAGAYISVPLQCAQSTCHVCADVLLSENIKRRRGGNRRSLSPCAARRNRAARTVCYRCVTKRFTRLTAKVLSARMRMDMDSVRLGRRGSSPALRNRKRAPPKVPSFVRDEDPVTSVCT